MNYRVFLVSLFVLFTFNADLLLGQTLEIVDETTLEPIPNVYIYNNGRNKMAATDAEGVVDISKFTEADTLNFQHPSYQSLSLSYQQVEGRGNQVKLTEKSVVMEEVYVSASKRVQDITEIPQRISQISEEQMLFNNPQTSADLLQSSGEVFVQKSQMGGGSPMIRGFAANSVLITVDGVRMNNAIFRSGNLQNVISVDANALSNAEVLFGPGSIIYGSDALGGVMNFQTKEPVLSFDSEKSEISVNSMARYSSANNERTVHADASFGYEKWGAFTSITYTNFDDMQSGGNFYDEYSDFGKREEYVDRIDGQDTVLANGDVTRQRPTGYEQLNIIQKFRYKPNNDWDASYGFHYATSSDIPRYDRLIQRENGDSGQLVNAEWYYGPQIWMMNTLNIKYFGETDLFDNITGVFSQQWFQESRNDRGFQDVQLRNREENVDVYTVNLDFDKIFEEGKELYYGLEGVYNYVDSEASTKNIETDSKSSVETRYPSGGSDYMQLAAYAKYEQDLASNITAIAGTRYSHVMLDAQFDPGRFEQFDEITFNTGALSGSLGFTYRPAEDLQLNLNGATGFRAPNVDDAAKVFDSEPGTVIVPNDDIQPEKSYNLDFSIIKKFADDARLELNTYYTWLKDAMVRRDFGDEFGQDSIMYDGVLSNVEAVVNAGEAYIYGASAEFTAELWSDLSVDSKITFTEGRDITNDEPLRHVAPLFGRSSITYRSDKIKIEAYTEYNASKDISDFSPSERNKPYLYTADGTPGWATLNLKTSYRFDEDIQLDAGVENILDKHYRPYSSGISAAGRNVRISVRAGL